MSDKSQTSISSMNKTPIVMVNLPIKQLHDKYSQVRDFLKINRKQIKHSEFYYITEPDHFNDLSTGVNYRDFFCKQCEAVEENFINFSGNPAVFELYCILRWFILRNFMIKHNLDSVIYIDNDVLFLSPLSDWPSEAKNSKYTLSRNCSPHLNYINCIDALITFCEFCFGIYVDKNEEMDFIQKKEQESRKKNLPFSVNDMVLWSKFFRKAPEHGGYRDLSAISKDNESFDHNINTVTNFPLYYENETPVEYEGSNLCKFSKLDMTYKQIKFDESGAYSSAKTEGAKTFKPVRMHTLHLQGASKGLVSFIDKELKNHGCI